jgi:hypothetical protein
MQRIHHQIIAWAMIATGTVTVSSVSEAQSASGARGLVLGVYSVGAQGVSIDNDASAFRFATGSGTGGGVMIGYGMNRNLTAFVSLDVAKQRSTVEDFDGTFALVHGEVGIRASLAGRASTAPYISAAVGARALGAKVTEPGLDDAYGLSLTGNLWSVGGGIEHAFTPNTALDAGVSVGFGAFDKVNADGEEFPIQVNSTRSIRVRVGLTWRP